MSQAILPLAAGARKVMIVQDGEMKMMKRNGNGANAATQPHLTVGDVTKAVAPVRQKHIDSAMAAIADGPDIQDQFAADLEAGVTGEIATGEAPKPPSLGRRKPQIFQDAAAPPAPELAEAEMDRLLQEAAQAENDAAKVAEDQRFQRQQAVQAGAEASDVPAEEPAVTAKPRKREPRVLAMTGRPCGKCGGSGQTGTQDTNGQVFMGACAVCQGQGQVQTFARGPKFR
jgi:hypothetical protein